MLSRRAMAAMVAVLSAAAITAAGTTGAGAARDDASTRAAGGAGDHSAGWITSRPSTRCNQIYGTQGDDVLYGTSSCDHINGLGGNDVIHAFGGDDLIRAGAGNDTVYGGSGADEVFGESGDDLLIAGYDTEADYLNGGFGDDMLDVLDLANLVDEADGFVGVDCVRADHDGNAYVDTITNAENVSWLGWTNCPLI